MDFRGYALARLMLVLATTIAAGHLRAATADAQAPLWIASLDNLDGALVNAPRCEHLENFDRREICLDPVRIEVFCHLVFVNLDTGSFKCFGCGQSGRAITLNWGGIASVCASSGMESAPEGQARTCFLMASASACVKSIQGFLLGSKTFPSPFTHLPL